MPKSKVQEKIRNNIVDEEKIINADMEEKDAVADIALEEDEDDATEDAMLDDEEINPFGDKWEE